MAARPYVTGIQEYLVITNTRDWNPPNAFYYPIIGRGTMVTDSEVQDIRSVGSFKPQQQREGLLRAYGNTSILLQDPTIFTNMIRNPSTGKLGYFNVQGGNNVEGQSHYFCKWDTISLEFMSGAPVRSTLSWKGLDSQLALMSASLSTIPTWPVAMWFNVSIEGDAALDAIDKTSIVVNINNNVDWRPVLTNSPTLESIGDLTNWPLSLRAASYLVEGSQVINCELKSLIPEAVELGDDTLDLISQVNINITGDELEGPMVIQLKNLKRGQHERPFSPGELIEHGLRYNVEDIAIVSL